jgi:2-methylcitrate dehydratase PrpD
MLDLLKTQPLRPDEIDGITVRLSENYATVLRNHLPQTGLAAKFSIEFAMASAVVANRVSLTELTDAFVRRQDVQSLMSKVKVETNTDYDPEEPAASVADQVIVRRRAGDDLESERVNRARGHAKKPSAGRLFAKLKLSLAGRRTWTCCVFRALAGYEALPPISRLVLIRVTATRAPD